MGASIVAVGSAVLMLGGGASTALAADNCSNAEFRVGPSALLPDCRAYELVSPADKDAYTLTVANAAEYPSLSGDQMFFTVITPFADPLNGSGGRYVSRRGTDGWTTRWMTPRFCKADQSGQIGGFASTWFSRDFSIALLKDPDDSNCDPNDHAGADLYRYDPDGSLTWLSHNGAPKTANVAANFVGGSDDASHVVFTTSEKLVTPFDDARATGPGMYDRMDNEVRPVAVANDGSPINACGVGTAGGEGSVSSDGRVIFFNSGSSTSVLGCSTATDDGGQLYARIDHAKTVMVSKSVRATPDTRRVPSFSRATRDGRKVLFRSAERLTDDATVNGGLYQYDLTPVLDGTASVGILRFLSPTYDGSNAGVSANSSMSADGSVVYFSATGVLVPGAPASGTKIYRAAGGDVTLVISSLAPSEPYGTSADGTKLAYLTAPPGSSFAQVHLYDANDGSTTCVSCPPGGASPVGAAKLTSNDRPPEIGVSRHVTNDGRVFFSSPDQLVARDTNAKHDVYEYFQGQHHLLSSGTSDEDSLYTGADDDGKTVFISTHDSLLPEDYDNGDQDLYAVRIGGGFPQPTGNSGTCVGDACQGAVGGAPAPLFPGSGGYVGAGSLPSAPAKKTASASKLTLVKGSRLVRGTSGAVRVRVSGKGKVRTSGSGLRRSLRTVKRSGTAYRVPVRLSTRAKRTLSRKGRVGVRVTVRFTPEKGAARSTRVRMTFRKAKKSSSRSKARPQSAKSETKAGERAVTVGAASDEKGGR